MSCTHCCITINILVISWSTQRGMHNIIIIQTHVLRSYAAYFDILLQAGTDAAHMRHHATTE
jgi:hypothetical protein